MAFPTPLTPTAYTGISVPIRAYNAGESNKSIINTDGNQTYTFTIRESGAIQGFLCSFNIRSFSGASSGTFTILVKRNGQVLQTTTYDASQLNTNGLVPGVIFIENLGFLSGAEVYQNESFTMLIENALTGATTMTYDATINMVALSKGNQFF